MFRRRLSLAILAILAVQLLGGIVLASDCAEPCPDDTEEASCPPVCAFCTTCTHSQSAIVRQGASGTPQVVIERHLAEAAVATSSQLAADIFHVPLPG